ncbi:MAG TPA: hypothetical protein VFL14_10530, partial [Xanthomonadales bacterium]|nr:hypothetical protein [Xanthomonadales bacterium]
HQLAKGIAGSLARRASGWLGGPLLRYAAPVAKVAATTATTIAMTYAIGMRSRALAKMRHADFEDWPDLIREVTALDERRLTEWAERSVRLVAEQSGTIAKGLMAKLAGLVPDMGAIATSRRVAAKPAPKKRAAAKKRPAAKKAAPANRARRAKPKA